MIKLLLAFFLLLGTVDCNITDIKLNLTNNLIIKGGIDEQLTTDFIYEFNKLPKKGKNNTYIYLDTPGGSVQEGMKIVTLIKNYNLSCIAEKAYSMGFIIFQSCKKRLILSHSSLMQHQMSLGIMNEKGNIDAYMKYINEIEDELTAMQASRLLLSRNQFRNKTVNEWWMYGENILKYRAADEIVKLECDPLLTKSTFTRDVGPFTYTYSKCPIVNGPVKKDKNKNQEQFIFFM